MAEYLVISQESSTFATATKTMVNHPVRANGNRSRLGKKVVSLFYWPTYSACAYMPANHTAAVLKDLSALRGAIVFVATGRAAVPLLNRLVKKKSMKRKKMISTSFPEQLLLFYMKQMTVAEGQQPIGSLSLDIYMEKLNAAIEYDGERYHRSDKVKERDARKDALCRKAHIRLIRVKEADGKGRDGDVVYMSGKGYSTANFQYVIDTLAEMLGLTAVSVDVKRDAAAILQQYEHSCIENSLAVKRPDVAAEWNYERNGDLTPDMFSYGSVAVVWWRCKEGHEWSQSISQRAGKKNSGCPYCSGRMCITGVNDLQTVNPDVAAEWHPTLNGELKPSEVAWTCRHKAWFRCKECGHVWHPIIANRGMGRGCPVCGRSKRDKSMTPAFIRKYGSCIDGNPLLKREWAYDLNKGIDPLQIVRTSWERVWWRCSECGHEWQTSIRTRAMDGKGCPVCAHRTVTEKNLDRALRRNGSFVDAKPELLDEWNWELNKGIDPNKVPKHSHYNAWWTCSKCGATYQRRVADRVEYNSPCHRHQPKDNSNHIKYTDNDKHDCSD